MTTSLESELDRRIEELIGKMVDGTASPEDMQVYQETAKKRARLMYPPPLPSPVPGPYRTRRYKVAV